MQQTIDKAKTRELIDKNTELLKKSGVLPENYPNHKVSKPYTILRSELNDYNEKFNKDFVLPENSVIIENVK